MTNSQKKKRTTTDRRNKAQLLNALQQNEELLAQKEETLQSAQDALAQAQSQIETLESLKDDLENKDAELKRTEQLYVEMVEEANRLRQELNNGNQVAQESKDDPGAQDEIEALQTELAAVRKNAEKSTAELAQIKDHLSEAKQKLRMANGQLTQLRKDIESAEAQVVSEQENDGELLTEISQLKQENKKQAAEIEELKKRLSENAASKSDTPSEAPANEGDDAEKLALQQKIEDLEKTVAALDLKLQKVREQKYQELPKPPAAVAPPPEVKPIKKAPPKPNPILKYRRLPRLSALKTVVSSGEDMRLIQHNQAFQVILKIDLADAAKVSEERLSYSAAVYAKPLAGGSSRVLQGAVRTVDSAGTLAVTVEPDALSQGAYRLWADVTIQEDEMPIPVTPLQQIHIVHVN